MADLNIQDVSFSYNDEKVLRNINLQMDVGDRVALIGANGSGKSTLFKIISGLLKNYRGDIFVQGKNIRDYSKKELSRKIASVMQFHKLEYEFTVDEIVSMGRYPYIKPLRQLGDLDREIVDRAMEDCHVYDLRHRRITQLSGGEVARVMLAQSIAQQPLILLLDEATSHLDINHQSEVFHLLLNLQRKERMIIFMVVHDINIASRYCSKIAVMKKGSLLGFGPPDEIIRKDIMERAFETEVVVENNRLFNVPHVYTK